MHFSNIVKGEGDNYSVQCFNSFGADCSTLAFSASTLPVYQLCSLYATLIDGSFFSSVDLFGAQCIQGVQERSSVGL